MRMSFAIGLTLTSIVLSACGKASSAQSGPAKSAASGDFDRAATLSALSAAATRAQSCEKPEGPHGAFRIDVRYGNDGHVESAWVEPPFESASDDSARRAVAGEVQNCVEDIFRNASVPPFGGLR